MENNDDDMIERFRMYSTRFKQASVSGEVYTETLEYIIRLRKERDELCEALREISQMKDEPYSAEFAVDTLHHVRLVRKA